MRKDEQLHETCITAGLIVADGIPVVWIYVELRTPLKERLAGIDFLTHLLEVSSPNQLSVYFLSDQAEVLQQLVKICHDHSFQDDHFLYPVHLNPHVQQLVYQCSGHLNNVKFIPSVDDRDFVVLMNGSKLGLTDSVGYKRKHLHGVNLYE